MLFNIDQKLLNEYKGIRYYAKEKNGVITYHFINTPIGDVMFDTEEDYTHHPNPIMVLLELNYCGNDLFWHNCGTVARKAKELIDYTHDKQWVSDNINAFHVYYVQQTLKDLNELQNNVNYWTVLES